MINNRLLANSTKFDLIKASFKIIHCCHSTSLGCVALNFIIRITGFLDFVHHTVFKLEHILQTKKLFSVNITTNTSTYYDATCCCTVVWIILAIASISNQQCHSEEAINDNRIQFSVDVLHLLTMINRPNIIYILLQNIVTSTIQLCFHTISQNSATAILYCSNRI
jgi:hypothetical protein